MKVNCATNLEELRQEYVAIRKGTNSVNLGARSLDVLKRMLDDPNSVAVRSISELAAEFSISTSSLTRLAQKLGFPGFPGLQAIFRQDINERKHYYSEQVERYLYSADQTSDNGDLPLQRVVQSEWSNVMMTRESFDNEQFQKAVSLLVGSRNISILGLRSSHSLAFYFAYYMRMIREGVSVVDTTGSIMAESLVDCNAGDTLFAIGVSPYTRLTIEACRVAKKRGVNVVVLTDRRSSDLAYEADSLLLISAQKDFFFSSVTSGMLYLKAILSEMALRLGDKAIQRLRDHEAILHEMEIEVG